MTSDSDTTELSPGEKKGNRSLGKRARLGVLLIFLSIAVWFAILGVPFLHASSGFKWIVGLLLWLSSYAFWFLGLYMAGREVAGPFVNWFWKWLPWRKSPQGEIDGG
ncbi:MAG: hypothetical protein QGH11_06780 [Pirellulaceae bacterium]|nr:hypothetical protein [Pirellulaceae bacterium]